MGLPKGLQAGSTKEVAWQGLRRPAQQADSPVARQETQRHCCSDQAPEGPWVSRALGHRSRVDRAFGKTAGPPEWGGGKDRAMPSSSPGYGPAIAEAQSRVSQTCLVSKSELTSPTEVQGSVLRTKTGSHDQGLTGGLLKAQRARALLSTAEAVPACPNLLESGEGT